MLPTQALGVAMRRREFITSVGGAVTLMSGLAEAAATTAFDWQTVAPKEADLPVSKRDSTGRCNQTRLEFARRVVARGGRIVLERYFEGEENSWGKLLGRTQLGPDTLHNLYSVTKSVVGLLYGVALAEGKVPPPDASLYEQFSEYKDLVEADPRRKERTIADALTMTLGLQWDEIF